MTRGKQRAKINHNLSKIKGWGPIFIFQKYLKIHISNFSLNFCIFNVWQVSINFVICRYVNFIDL